jgi:hypothetical protein
LTVAASRLGPARSTVMPGASSLPPG